ncbi:MAG: zinc metallopeptidase [Atopostipes suicloacalis]|nr:zinc metallopeptidase [Atopostipes suicloacalis]
MGLAISGLASSYVQSTYRKYSQMHSRLGYDASEITRLILDYANLENVEIEHIRGDLTDHYDSKDKTLRLSDSTIQSKSVAAIGVAAHEAGHALQDRDNYFYLRLRSALVPITNIGQTAAFPILMLGLLFPSNSSQVLINLGLILFSLTFLFQIVTLPVEFDASNRALSILETQEILVGEELESAQKVLRAAALTYVAAAIASFLNVLRLFLLFGGRSND